MSNETSNESLPGSWHRSELGKVAKWGSGGTPKAGNSSYYGGNIPWAIIGDLNDGVITETASTITQLGLDESSSRLVPKGTLLIAMYGSIGKLGIAGMDLATNQAIAFATPLKDVVTHKFLFHYLASQKEAFLASGKGMTQQNISQTMLKAWPIPLPPVAEQEKIVEILEEQFLHLDRALDSRDAVRNKSTNFRRSLLYGTLAEPGQDSGSRKEEDWQTTNLGSVVNFLNGYAFKSEWYVENGIRLVRGQNISHGFLDWKDTRKVSESKAGEFSRFNLNEGDILVSLDRPIISTGFKWAVVKKSDLPALLLQRVAVIRPNSEILDSGYLRLWVQSPHLVEKINPGKSNGIPHISTNELSALQISFPSLENQRRLVGKIELQLESLLRCEDSTHTISIRAQSLRRSLLNAAFTGELTKNWREGAHV